MINPPLRDTFMKKATVTIVVGILALLTVTFSAFGEHEVFGGPNGIHPYLFNGVSRNKLGGANNVRHPWSILGSAKSDTAELHIRAVLVEFQLDSSEYTTGNGKFGIFQNRKGSPADAQEWEYYKENGGDEYIYDDLPHDYDYFQRQLDFVHNYYDKVSRGRMKISSSIYPRKGGKRFAYTVPEKMTKYSPGSKMPAESWDEYYYRRTRALIEFIRDAVYAADTTGGIESPFAGLRDSGGVLIDSLGRRTGILIVHAGASYLTDGGKDGAYGMDTPSDMIDAFISTDIFAHFADSLGFTHDSLDSKRAGIRPSSNKDILIDELMMVSETSNQDGLNWGIHGILVNQVARQIGIPDLFSTMSGISGVGAFCMMDFAGYSTGNGFIPPWPSAWVRAFMGWDTPVVVDVDSATNISLRAVSASGEGDTSLVLVPINDHEYYLLENRQRNLTDDDLFVYDTTVDADGRHPIDPYNHVDIDKNVIAGGASNIVDSALNYDIGIPASGVLVWHIDENIVRDRFEHNLINADSLYRAVSLVEADGVTDLGVEVTDMFYQAAYDYGGAQDVFPHRVMKRQDHKDYLVKGFGPFTRPSTQSNDGGHTHLEFSILNIPKKTELSLVRGYYVKNYVDSVFQIRISRDMNSVVSSGWPKRMAASSYYEPAICDVYENGDSLELAIVDTAGRLYVWQADGKGENVFESFGNLKAQIQTPLITLPSNGNNSIVDSIRYLSHIDKPAGMPTTIGGSLYIPSRNGFVYVLHSITGVHDNPTLEVDSIPLSAPASSYITNYAGSKWAAGCADGSVVFGDGSSIVTEVAPVSSGAGSPVVALAVADKDNETIAAVHKNGILRIVSPDNNLASTTFQIGGGIAPYTLTVADLNPSDDVDCNLIVTDSRQGLWMVNFTDGQLSTAPGWKNKANDWPGLTYSPEEKAQKNRTLLPINGSAPSLADVNNDGVLDIVIGGTNGIFAMNERGVLLPPWPSYLDNRYWYQRGTVDASPVIMGAADSLRVLFASPTGERVTFSVSDIDSSDKKTGTIYYRLSDDRPDSITGLTASFIDSLMVFGDSLVLPYVTPGGFVDALGPSAKRPTHTRKTNYTGTIRVSQWPLTTGSASGASPLVSDIDGDGGTDLFAVTKTGWVYRWELGEEMVPSSAVWPQVGFSSARTFAYEGPPVSEADQAQNGITHFYNYPNPVKGLDETVFKYELTNDARNVRLDIYTYTGFHAFEKADLPTFGGWNEYQISAREFGSGVYRCRLEVEYDGKTEVKMWKMAIVR